MRKTSESVRLLFYIVLQQKRGNCRVGEEGKKFRNTSSACFRRAGFWPLSESLRQQASCLNGSS